VNGIKTNLEVGCGQLILQKKSTIISFDLEKLLYFGLYKFELTKNQEKEDVLFT